MQLNILSKQPPSAINIVGTIVFLSTILFLVSSFCFPDNSHAFFYEVESTNYPAGIPVRLEIPKINLDVAVASVGVTKNGLMDVPPGHRDAGWFKFGTRPGDNGSAVIDGHYGYWRTGEKTVFNDLNKLEKGDELYIEDENGMIITFVVRDILLYDPNKDASSVFNSNDGKAHLNLVTCDGILDKIYNTYSKRLVVFTDKK